MVIYVIEKGDTISSISEKYNLNPQKLMEDNNITAPDNLVVGQAIVIAEDTIIHIVERNETLYSISQKYGVPLENVITANPNITNPNNLQIGEQITIPLTQGKLGKIEVNGYTYTNISDETLSKILPNLTWLSIFSYEVNFDGTLKVIDDESIITMANSMGVKPLMVITNIDESFSGELAHEIFTNPEVQTKLIANILNTIKAKGYAGLNVDFEYINPEDKENYNQFVERLSRTLKQMNLYLMTALAPKISADQKGTLYEAHDYARHGELVDRVILMTYEWGYLYGEPQAISPTNKVEEVLNYAVTVIPPDKILMGVSNYAYDWTLPFTKGDSAVILSNYQAVELAREVGSFIAFDEKTSSPFFEYFDNDGKKHIVWFDDARSYYTRLKLVEKYHLAGVSIWTINNYFAPFWLVLNGLYNIVKIK